MISNTSGINLINILSTAGDNPTFTQPLYVGRPNIGNRERLHAMLDDMLDRRWLSNNGQFVQEFERRTAELLGVPHAVAFCNATVALECTARALGLSGEVIVPSYTFIATVHSLHLQGITPVFCDINPATHCLDPECVESLITPRTSAISAVHLWGRPAAIERLQEIAAHHGLALLFDAAHAFGASYNGRMIGNFGDAEVFSFHATKFLNSFEGGLVTTHNGELAARLRLMKNFGFHGLDNVVMLGTNGKMTEICAAMGLVNLEALGEFVAVNRANYQSYQRYLAGIPGIILLSYEGEEHYNYQYIVIEIDEQLTSISRDNIIKVLHAENVIARKYFWPGCHCMEPYRTLYPEAHINLPITKHLSDRVIVLPTGTSVDDETIRTICLIIATALTNAAEVSAALT